MKTNPDLAVVELKAGPLHCKTRGASSFTKMELIAVVQCTTQCGDPRTRYRLTKGKGRFLPTISPKEPRDTECPLVVDNGVGNHRSLELPRTDRTQEVKSRDMKTNCCSLSRECSLTRECKTYQDSSLGNQRFPKKQRGTKGKYHQQLGS